MTRELRREKYANQEMVYSYYFMLWHCFCVFGVVKKHIPNFGSHFDPVCEQLAFDKQPYP